MAFISSVPSAMTFRAALKHLGLTQRVVAAMLGVDATTVNRWGSDRADGLPVPTYAVTFLRAYAMLSSRARRQLVGEIEQRAA